MEDSFGLEDEDVPIVEAVTGTCRLGNVFGIEILTEDTNGSEDRIVEVIAAATPRAAASTTPPWQSR